MRMFFAGLLLLNVAFGLWYWFMYEPVTVQPPRADHGVEMLRLVSEQQQIEDTDHPVAQVQQHAAVSTAESQPAPTPKPDVTAEPAVTPKPDVTAEPAVTPESVATPKPAVTAEPPPVTASNDVPEQAVQARVSKSRNQCYLMGVFEQRQAAEYRMTEMHALGYIAKVAIQYTQKANYVVYLPAYPSYAEASVVTEQLRERGKQDFQILAIKGQKNSISLGVYSRPGTAEIRRREIAALGYEPVVAPIYGEPSGYTIEFRKKDGSELDENEKDFLLISEKKLTIDTVKCGS